MKFFRRTNVHTIKIHLKGGSTIQQDFYRYDFNYNHDDNMFTSFDFYAANGGSAPIILLPEIAAIERLGTRRIWMWREKKI